MSRGYDSTRDRAFEVFESAAPVTLRLDADTLLTADHTALTVILAADEAGVDAVELEADLDRAEVTRILERAELPGLTMIDLVRTYSPRRPLTLRWRGADDLRAALNQAVVEGDDLARSVAATGPNRFPACFDLALYDFEALHQRP